jgi:DNA polymerase/3'-5' exonuclease PolX
MSDKKKFIWYMARDVAREMCDYLRPVTERLIVAGSLRRRNPLVGDVEILYVPKRGPGVRTDMFQMAKAQNLTDLALEQLIARGIITKRPNRNGAEAWGSKNKLAVHVATGIPVDFFSTEPSFWFNYLVCRTGPAESNMRIAAAAKRKGWKWNPYRAGFTDDHGEIVQVKAERDVFEFVGLPYREPCDRI